MISKLLHGELALKESFWKFGVLGLFFCAVVTRVIKAFLSAQLNGLSIVQYYTNYFSPLKMNGALMFLTLMYFFAIFILSVYSLIVVLGVWRSAGQYDKSVWLGQIARIFIFLVAYIALRFGFLGV